MNEVDGESHGMKESHLKFAELSLELNSKVSITIYDKPLKRRRFMYNKCDILTLLKMCLTRESETPSTNCIRFHSLFAAVIKCKVIGSKQKILSFFISLAFACYVNVALCFC